LKEAEIERLVGYPPRLRIEDIVNHPRLSEARKAYLDRFLDVYGGDPLETQNARAGFRRAQFQLWIFSCTIRRRSSKKWLSRLKIGRGEPNRSLHLGPTTTPRHPGLQHLGVHAAEAAALEPKRARRPERQVEHASAHERPAVVDGDDDAALSFRIADANPGANGNVRCAAVRPLGLNLAPDATRLPCQ